MEKQNSINLNNVKNIHLIGIGGSGIFPIAKVLLEKGFNVTGSDMCESETTEKAQNAGIKVFIGHHPQNIKGADVVVFSAAIKSSNPEIQEAQKLHIPCLERSVMLGIIMDKYKNSIAVAGTHGKTSTTSMITHILIDSQKSPTAIIGGTLNKIKGNSCIGKSDIIVCEACEYVDSFLQLNPHMSIILNVDADHLDYFKNLDGVKSSFHKFAQKTTNTLIVNGDDKNARDITKDTPSKKIFYGLSSENEYYAENIEFNSFQYASFDIVNKGSKLIRIDLAVPGKHNIYNALAAFIACLELGVAPETIAESIKTFTGAHRRFEFLDNINNITIADDFAHHPSEINATISSAMKMGFKRVVVVFQPHTFSRTFMFLDEFAQALSSADKVVLTDILPVRETNLYNIYSKDLAAKIPNCVCLNTFDQVSDFIASDAKPGDLILTMGGGNVYMCAHMIIDKLKSSIN